ncbi:TSUP family transporter [Bacillus sp. 3103sda1]|nr:TSUP family transporter [Bacillus sp. 3103sda1]
MIQVFLSIVSETIVGFVLGLLGGGESILVVPLLLYVVGMKDPHVVIGTTVSAITINAYANLIPHVRAGTMCSGKWQSFLLYPVP